MNALYRQNGSPVGPLVGSEGLSSGVTNGLGASAVRPKTAASARTRTAKPSSLAKYRSRSRGPGPSAARSQGPRRAADAEMFLYGRDR